jgi:hypothetical protein
MNMELIVAKESLRGAVARKIICPIGGRVLDVKQAIMVEVTMTNGRVLTEVAHVDEEDELRARVDKIKNLPNVSGIEWYDGRELFGRKATK